MGWLMKKVGWLITAGIVAWIAFWAWLQMPGGVEVGNMPDCTTAAVQKLLRQAIEEAPGNKARQIKVLDAMDFASAPGSTNDRRICTATLFSNAGKETVKFTLEWMSAAKDKIWLQTVP
jgi:hypothetical protein